MITKLKYLVAVAAVGLSVHGMAQTPWYVGVEAAHNHCSSSLNTKSVNVMPGVTGGYRFSGLFDLGASLTYGQTTMQSRSCCKDYWLGADGVRYNAEIVDMDGIVYSELRSKVDLLRLRLSGNFNLLSLCRQRVPWTLTVSPTVSVVYTSATLNYAAIPTDSKLHVGYGATLGAGYKWSNGVALTLFTGITRLSGTAIDAVPQYCRSVAYIWDTGVRLTYNLP